MKKMSVQEIIEKLALEPLPGEGGYFRETYRSRVEMGFIGETKNRSLATAIYYLVTPTSFSALHRLPVDETFHIYSGGPVEMLLIEEGGKPRTVRLGNRLEKGEVPQFTVPSGTWQGSRLLEGDFALMGTTVYPGFEFNDLEMASDLLIADFPKYEDLIRRFLPN